MITAKLNEYISFIPWSLESENSYYELAIFLIQTYYYFPLRANQISTHVNCFLYPM